MDDPRWFAREGEHPWPEWVNHFRETQVTATDKVVAAFERGTQVVFLDAPTGAGKTLIAEMVRRELGVRGAYICSSKSLQDQFLRDFTYSRVLKGRANYPTQYMPSYTAADCGGMECRWCDKGGCPYRCAKGEAAGAAVGVLNTAYFLAETNLEKSAFSGRELVVVDEADTLEASLMGTVEFRLSDRTARELGVRVPVKGARAKTVQKWLTDELLVNVRAAIAKCKGDGVDEIRERARLGRLAGKARTVARHMSGEEGADGVESWGDWVRDYDDRRPGDLILKPVRVDSLGPGRLWRHGKRWLCMSATIISAEEQAESLGLEAAGLDWELVRVPMSFPVEHRPIIYRPIANMARSADANAEMKLAVKGLQEILDSHRDESILVHTVSYGLTKWLHREMQRVVADRPLWAYFNAGERDRVLAQFKDTPGAVIFAPSLDRGIDLPGDLCRVQVVAKMPYAYLGDRQVNERMRGPGGGFWYDVLTARTLVQMTGRAVRNDRDWAITYILDKNFGKWWAKGQRILPEWWKEAVQGG